MPTNDHEKVAGKKCSGRNIFDKTLFFTLKNINKLSMIGIKNWCQFARDTFFYDSSF